MTTPYATPRYPRGPYTTPTSQSASRKVPRAPVLNPFDQFPEPEFQSWIGDITGAIRAALGREDPPQRRSTISKRAEREEEVLEDSFADVKARRTAKGKERAVEVGDQEQPIVIESDEGEGAEDEESEEVARAIAREDVEAEQEEEEEEEEEEAEAREDNFAPWTKNDVADEAELGEESSEEDEAFAPIASASEVIELLSDEEDDEEGSVQQAEHEEDIEEDAEESEVGSDEEYNAAVSKLEQRLYARRETEEDEVEGEDEGEAVEEDAALAGESTSAAIEAPYTGFVEDDAADPDIADAGQGESEQGVDISDPWQGPSTYAEDFYSGGDFPLEHGDAANPHVLPTEEDDDIIEVAGPAGEPQSVGSRDISIAAEDVPDVQLPDPWIGPREYAEDYYAGGDISESDLRTRFPSPSHLTPMDTELTEFLTPDAGTPETAPVAGVDQKTLDVQDAEPSHSLMDQLFEDLVNENSADKDSVVVAQETEAKGPGAERPVSGATDSPSPPKFTSHVDWNWPPAFPEGRLTSGPGHLLSPEPRDDSIEVVEISDDEGSSAVIHEAAPAMDCAEASVADIPETVETSKAIPDETDELSEIQLADFMSDTSDFLSPSGEASEYTEQDTVDALYADLDAFISCDEQQMHVESQPPDAQIPSLDTMDTEAFIRDLLADPPVGLSGTEPSVGLDTPEPSLDAALEWDPKTSTSDPVSVELSQGIGSAGGAETTVEVILEAIRQDTPVALVEYEVEEPTTEGRRTEEPDDNPRAISPSLVAEELSDHEIGNTSVDTVSRDYAVSEPEGLQETADATLELEDFDDPTADISNDAATQDTPEDIDMAAQATEKVSTTEEDVHEIEALPVPAEPTVYGPHERELEPGVPMPVAADPTVPDPTSVAPSPQENKAPAPVDADVQRVDASTSRNSSVGAGPSSRGRSPSGLFTPLTAESSRPATPKLQASDLGEGHFESPLKNVVTAEQLTAAEEVDSTATNVADIQGPAVNVHDFDATQLAYSPAVTHSESETTLTTQVQLETVIERDGSAETSELDELNLEYPSDAEEFAVSAATNQEAGEHVNRDTSLDADAEGDVDPDYASGQHTATVDSETVEDTDAPTAEEPKADLPEDNMVGADTVSPMGPDPATDTADVAIERPKFDMADTAPGENAVGQDGSINGDCEPIPETTSEAPESLATTQEVPKEADDPFTAGFAQDPKDEGQDQDESHSSGPSEVRRLKRKREVLRLPPRVTRSMLLKRHATETSEALPKRQVQHADKGKGRSASRDGDEDPQTTESPSPNDVGEGDETMVAPQSTVASRTTSRSSSISAALTVGTSTPTSPAITRTQTYPQAGEPFRLIDAQEVMHHHHGRRVLQAAARMLGLRPRPTLQIPDATQTSAAASPSHVDSPLPSPSLPTPLTRPTSPVASVSSPSASEQPSIPPPASDKGPSTPDDRPISVAPPASDAGTSTPPPEVQAPTITTTPPPSLSAAPRKLKVGNSPVTRSRCRFHKISLPRQENGPRVYFVVPGCSLSNKELMKEEDIADHGVPSFPQGTKLVADLEHLNLNPYLLGILRQLVGVDLIREQEVFYLPQEGEQYGWKPKHQHKHVVSKANLSARGRKSIGAPIQSGPDPNEHSESASAVGIPSRAGSVSTVSSRQSRKGRISARSSVAYSASMAGSDYSDGSDGEERSSKRPKTEPVPSPTVEVEGDKEASASKAAAAASRRLGPSKRTRGLGKDASAYKPEPDDAESSSEGEQGEGTRRRRKAKQRGTKRPRSDEPNEEAVAETAPPKRRRTRKKADQKANGEDK